MTAATPPPATITLPPALESDLTGIIDAEVRDSVRRLMLAALAKNGAQEPDGDPG